MSKLKCSNYNHECGFHCYFDNGTIDKPTAILHICEKYHWCDSGLKDLNIR